MLRWCRDRSLPQCDWALHVSVFQVMSRYVKVVYDFHTTESGEISLSAGDVVRVVRQVDTNWLQGEIHGKIGNFPSNFVTELVLPPVSNGQKLFTAVRSFPAEVQGDLGFQKGTCGNSKIDLSAPQSYKKFSCVAHDMF